MGFWRLTRSSVRVLVCAAVVVAALPAGPAATAAQDAPRRTYIVTLDVPQAATALRTTGRRAARQRLGSRRADTRAATRRVLAAHDVQPRHRYSAALSGFSARLTAREAAELARDDEVANVRVARRIRVAAQQVPPGIRRVNAEPGGSPGPDVDVDIAIVDTGIGPVGGDELDVRGGVDCVDGANFPGDPDDSHLDVDAWTPSHGTHVAGIAAARDNDAGVVGVAPGARLWSVRVFDRLASGDESTLLCGLDWIVRTRLPGSPISQTIDVVNMSLEAVRLPFNEACNPGDPLDPIHDAVCAADALGIVVVVAAGNDGRNASTVIPAAYNQVITVGAMNDYDGQAGGKGSASCAPSGPDDRYAVFSNHGRDVDIVAPGTCVRSLQPNSDALRGLSGTSQATPHVSGAVARYLAAHPGTTPQEMRRLVRVSGRLDWVIRSDPDWSGPRDSDAPKRLLDVAAMDAPNGIRVWLSDSDLKVGKRETAREARVDIQRLGGFAGDVQLGLSGLPAAVGSASFDRPGASIAGPSGLGARLALKLTLDGPQGPQDLLVEASGSGGDPAGSRQLSLLVDRRGPRVTDLAGRILAGTTVGSGGAALTRMRWQVSDAWSKVTKASLQRRDSSGRWRSIKGSLEQARVTFKPGQARRFRVLAVDARGNAKASTPLTISMGVRDAESSSWVHPAGGGWRKQGSRSAYGGSLLTAGGPVAMLGTTFSGKSLALVAPVGPERGRLRLRIDGGEWQTVDLHNKKALARQVVFSQSVPRGGHEVEIQSLGDGKVAVDALLFLR